MQGAPAAVTVELPDMATILPFSPGKACVESPGPPWYAQSRNRRVCGSERMADRMIRIRQWMLVGLLSLLWLPVGCDRAGTLDLDAIQEAVGKRAFQFYRSFNAGDLETMGLHLSRRLVDAHPDVRTLPLVARALAGDYDRVMAQEVELARRGRGATVRVTLHRRVAGRDGAPDSLAFAGEQVHRWVQEGGTWYYDGPQ